MRCQNAAHSRETRYLSLIRSIWREPKLFNSGWSQFHVGNLKDLVDFLYHKFSLFMKCCIDHCTNFHIDKDFSFQVNLIKVPVLSA